MTQENILKDMEQELVRRCVSGDELAYKEIVERLEKPLINFIYKYIGELNEAEDIFQETFIKMMRSIKEYKPTATLTTWIFTIARNLCLDHLKYKRRHKALSLDSALKKDKDNVIYFQETLVSRCGLPEASANKAELEEKIKEALGRLTYKQREALILRIYMELPYSEIAEIVGARVNTAKCRVHDALRALNKLLVQDISNNGGLVYEM